MSQPIDQQELHQLFVAKTDGTITPEDHERLCALLKGSAEARKLWFVFQDTETGLLGWAQKESQKEEQIPITSKVTKADFSAANTGLWRSVSAMAAGIVIGALAWALWPKTVPVDTIASRNGSTVVTDPAAVVRAEATTASVAVLMRGANVVWDKSGMMPSMNAPLSPGVLKLQSGVAEIEFFQGARLCIEGPAEIRLISAGEAFCQSGRFSAHVPPHARGFKLGTPKGDIVDLGTDFGLDLSDAASELHVFNGEVELYQPQAQMRKLTTGAAADLTQSAKALVANESAFAFSRNLDARVNESRRQAFELWQTDTERWQQDADTRLWLSFQDEGASRSLRNTALNGKDIAAGSIVGCTWTEGRWPGKRALQFRSLSDRVRFNIPGTYKQLTLTASIQLHGLNVRQSSLCMSEGIGAGYMHWQILHNGSLCLGVGDGSRRVGANAEPVIWQDYISPVVFTPERFGQWVHLAAVYDLEGKEVRFYVDGKVYSTHPITKPITLAPGLVELGNWIPAPEKVQQPIRNFAGSMDEFGLVARVLTEAEIQQLAE
ncbi:MAG TPA: LamG-like jellyroll fold domain-containing protein [Verrucomicrobiae bacterium]